MQYIPYKQIVCDGDAIQKENGDIAGVNLICIHSCVIKVRMLLLFEFVTF